MLVLTNQITAQSINWNSTNKWVDSVFGTLTQEQKIAQLMVIGAFSNKDLAHEQDVECHVNELGVGGLIFFKGTPHRQAVLTNQYQKNAKIPLLISIDGEWGLSMRLDSTPTFPRQMLFGAANNIELTKEFGREVARECKRIGIHFNFAPDVDVNNNMANPVINDRSFGENKYIVAKHGAAYANGLQSENILASAKHFPGHGDTENDSHFSLPIIKGSRKRLDSLELFPFKELIKQNVSAIMSAHLHVPALDTTLGASSLSHKIVTDLLRNEMGFEGLIVTDALDMKAVSNQFNPGEVAAKALVAGNDMLLLVENVPLSVAIIKEYVSNGLITQTQIDTRCKKILLAKYWCGLSKYKEIELRNLYEDLNTYESNLLIRKTIKQGIVVAKNKDNLIPLHNPQNYKIASINVGSNQLSNFQLHLSNYFKCDFFAIDKNESREYFDSIFLKLNEYNLVIVSLHNTSRFVSKKFGLTQQQIDFVKKIAHRYKSILVNHGNPYILQHFGDFRNILVAFEDLPEYNFLAAQIVGGGFGSKGKMPVSVGENFALGSGIETHSIQKFEYIFPEEINIDHKKLEKIDSIVNDAIAQNAMPGCQVFVAKDGKVIYNKSFGFHTYDSTLQVKNHHLYDVASLTKILATTLAMMKLYEERKIKLDDKIGTYLPWLKGSDKEKLKIKDIMTHQAGLIPFIPFYKNMLIDGKLNPEIFADSFSKEFPIPVAKNIWLSTKHEDELWKGIAQSELKKQGEYIYSDLGFILLRKLIERVTKKDFELYLKEKFYTPLNLTTMIFNPLKTVNENWIAPSENDTVFRNQTLKGFVHDPSAALQGGISGNAGLFANANDVAIIMQMLLNNGTYGGAKIFKPSTVELFTKKFNKKNNRRALGFDKPEFELIDEHTQKLKTPTGEYCSTKTFGHAGFTGTCTWADPQNGTVFVYLSNRVYPSADNKKMLDLNVRTKIQDVIYEALK